MFKLIKSWLTKKEDSTGYVFSMEIEKVYLDGSSYEIFDSEMKKAIVEKVFTELKPHLLKDGVVDQAMINEIRLLVAKKFIEEK